MTAEAALAQALIYEKKIRDLYLKAAAAASQPEAKRFYEFLAKDEASHVAYIEQAIASWEGSQTISLEGLKQRLPEDIAGAVDQVKASFTAIDEGGQMAALENALKAEEETSAFYRSLLGKLPEQLSAAFGRLQAIEDGHTAIVRAELDSLTRSGHWFDLREFDMED